MCYVSYPKPLLQPWWFSYGVIFFEGPYLHVKARNKCLLQVNISSPSYNPTTIPISPFTYHLSSSFGFSVCSFSFYRCFLNEQTKRTGTDNPNCFQLVKTGFLCHLRLLKAKKRHLFFGFCKAPKYLSSSISIVFQNQEEKIKT